MSPVARQHTGDREHLITSVNRPTIPAIWGKCRILHLLHVLYGHPLRRASCMFVRVQRAAATD
jgi:hypothetical protein